MAQGSANDEAGDQLGEMVVAWAEAYWEQERQRGGETDDALREAVMKAFTAGAVTVFQRWDEVRPLVPRRRVSWRDLPSHHG